MSANIQTGPISAREKELPEGISIFELTAERVSELGPDYASKFWASEWKELLIDADGTQYGSIDPKSGDAKKPYKETAALLNRNGLSTEKEDWAKEVWMLASMGIILDDQGREVRPYWTLEAATAELEKFVTPVEYGGFGGRVLVVEDAGGNFIGFAAYTVLDSSNGMTALDRRFPYDSLLAPNEESSFECSLGTLVTNLYSDSRIGIFLDLAIAPEWQGKGIGAALFDRRIEMLKAEGAEVIIGRTTEASPAQYAGNYLKRGMSVLARDSKDSQKVICLVETSNLTERP